MPEFNGTWKIDVSRSHMWSYEEQRYIPDEIGDEVVNLMTKDGVQQSEVLYGDDPVIRMGYTAKFDDPQWVPYRVHEIIQKEQTVDLTESIEQFRKRVKSDRGVNERQFVAGEPYGMIRIIRVDDRTQYRIQRSVTGEAQSVMMRHLSDDGNSYRASVLDRHGVVFRIRWFVRV